MKSGFPFPAGMKSSDFIKIIPPLPQPELHKKLAEFDIGLAIDLSTADYGRNGDRPWVKIQSARWVKIQSARTSQGLQERAE